jgi:hypothetical protein
MYTVGRVITTLTGRGKYHLYRCILKKLFCVFSFLYSSKNYNLLHMTQVFLQCFPQQLQTSGVYY